MSQRQNPSNPGSITRGRCFSLNRFALWRTIIGNPNVTELASLTCYWTTGFVVRIIIIIFTTFRGPLYNRRWRTNLFRAVVIQPLLSVPVDSIRTSERRVEPSEQKTRVRTEPRRETAARPTRRTHTGHTHMWDLFPSAHR